MKYRITFRNHEFVDVTLDEYISKVENEKRAVILAQAEQIKLNKSCIDIKSIDVLEHIIRTVDFPIGQGWLNIYTNIKGYSQAGGIYKTKQIAHDVAKKHCRGAIFITWRELFK